MKPGPKLALPKLLSPQTARVHDGKVNVHVYPCSCARLVEVPAPGR